MITNMVPEIMLPTTTNIISRIYYGHRGNLMSQRWEPFFLYISWIRAMFCMQRYNLLLRGEVFRESKEKTKHVQNTSYNGETITYTPKNKINYQLIKKVKSCMSNRLWVNVNIARSVFSYLLSLQNTCNKLLAIFPWFQNSLKFLTWSNMFS